MAASLTFDSVTKRYDTTEALAGIDLTIEAGSFVALVGASGSGKSTLLKTINRLVEPTTGRVLLDGEDVTTRDATAMRRQMGYVFQRIGLFPHMRVGENIAIGPRLVGDNLSRERIGELLEKSEPEDLLKFGLIPEFVGRLPVIASLHDLDVDALVTILQEPKNAIAKQYHKLFELEDVELTFTDEALRAIDIAIDDQLPVLVLSFHSPSLAAGHTPYVRTEADLDALYDWFRGVYAYLDTRGVRPTTVEEIMASVDA